MKKLVSSIPSIPSIPFPTFYEIDRGASAGLPGPKLIAAAMKMLRGYAPATFDNVDDADMYECIVNVAKAGPSDDPF
jgi:hypothetical protein